MDHLMETVGFLLIEYVISIALLLMSPNQPFPGPSRRFGYILLLIAALLTIGETAPRPVSVNVHIVLILSLGSFGLLKGIRNMLVTREEVIVAPFSGFLFIFGVLSIMILQWSDLSQIEQIVAFLTMTVLMLCQIWLTFRGLIIGKLNLAWSKAGLLALQRGQISSDSGAISCFEKAWDLEEEHLNPMAWLALERIHSFLGNSEEAKHWAKSLQEVGGEGSVAKEWIDAIETALADLSRN